MFWDPVSVGGEPGEVGNSAAFFSSRIAFLRATRQMVGSTFQYLTMPLHIALVGLLEFIVEIMVLFTSGIGGSAGTLEDVSSASMSNSGTGVSELFTFGQVNLQLVEVLVTSVVLVITCANAFAPKAASGGHNLMILYYLSITMIIAGVLMLVVPAAASSMFHSILEGTPS